MMEAELNKYRSMTNYSQKFATKVSKPMRDINFYLYCYTLGKEEIFDGLARHFNTKIQVMKDRWFKMNVAGLDMS
jgi:hypothetical protein